uniref:Microfibril associated protein 5 n=1 Tax=Paramormyrops kingsleyae TaxID=1676925 RepID=A0A3B3R8G0_9TELE|nr:microfibrillar-associated protein 2-like [Paramormyrops kingsleyae]
MGRLPVAVLLCSFQVIVAVVSDQQAVTLQIDRGDGDLHAISESPQDCREETYPCTRMYSVQQPIKRCIHSLCLYSIPRVYLINKEICVRTVCQQEEIRKADLCRERSGWPKRMQRSVQKRCRRGNPKTWENRT